MSTPTLSDSTTERNPAIATKGEADEVRHLGTFEVASGAVVVADPCYDNDATKDTNSVPAANGIWNVEVFYTEGWGVRPFRLAAHLDPAASRALGSDLDARTANGFDQLNFPVFVDSGQAGIFDQAAFCNGDGLTPADTLGLADPDGAFYAECCDLTLSAQSAGVLPHGGVSSSGYGDGSYAAYARFDNDGNAVAIVIDFLGEDDEDEDEDEDF